MSQPDFLNLIERFLKSLRQTRFTLGSSSVVSSDRYCSDLDKRQSKFEYLVYYLARDFWLPRGLAVRVEGWKMVVPPDKHNGYNIYIDPVDGTAGDVRSHGCGAFQHTLPVTSVVSIGPDKIGMKFGDLIAAGSLCLNSGQMFLAGLGQAYTIRSDGSRVKLKRTRQYDRHNPIVAGEITRRAVAAIRFLIPHQLEFVSDSHSSFQVMLYALLGYVDAYFNFNLPGLTGAGQRGHELGAISVFARELGAYLLATETSGAVDEMPFTFDGQTGVIAAVDKETAMHYWNMIQSNLKRETIFWGSPVRVETLIRALYDAVPKERWSLRPVQKNQAG